jgi:HEAT repeat protein
MLHSALRRALLTASGLFVATAMSHAQDAEALFGDGIDAYRTGDTAGAVELFKDALAQNPAQDEVYAVWSQAEQRVILDMLQERGEMGAMAKRFLGLAKLGRASVASDPGGARDVVQSYLTSGALESQAALLELQATYGEWAVPALVGPMADRSDADARVMAIKALIHLGDMAAPALIETLKSDDEMTRTNAASTLGSIGDVRAAAALAWMARSDSSDVARAVAADALSKMSDGLVAVGVRSSDALDITLSLTGHWITGDATLVRPYASGQVAWTWDGGLNGEAVPAGLYGLVLAESAIQTALASMDGDGAMARGALAAIHASMKAEIMAASGLESLSGDELLEAATARLPAIEVSLARAGDARGSALEWLLSEGQVAAAQALMGSMGAGHSEVGALRMALDHGNDGVAFSAAAVLASVGEADGSAVGVLADALTSVPDRLAFSIGQSGLNDSGLNGGDGWSLLSSGDVASGLSRAKAFPPKDVILLEHGLGGVTIDTMVFGLRNDPRSAGVPIIVVASADAASALSSRYADSVSAVVSDAATWQDVNGAAGDTGAQRAAAMERATVAARALAGLSPDRLGGVGAAASEALGAGADDDVKVAVLDLVRTGMLADALPAVESQILSGAGNDDVHVAALLAAERLWAARGGSAGDGAALYGAVSGMLGSGNRDVVLAAARALGQLGYAGGDVAQAGLSSSERAALSALGYIGG